MRKFLTTCLLLASCQVAFAQQDLYQWQLSGYTGIANYINEDNNSEDYFKINNNLLHRLEFTRYIGSSFGLSLGYSLGEVRGNNRQPTPFTTDVHMAAARAYFYTDNGWMLNASSWVSPYFFGGYGLSILHTSHSISSEESRYVPVIPFGVGLKFRIAERWQLALQTEGVYLPETHLQEPALEQNEYNNSFLHTGIRIGYSFGFRKSTFKAPRFYAGTIALPQNAESTYQPRQNELEMMLKMEPRQVQVIPAPDAVNRVTQPEMAKRAVVSPGDTLATRTATLDTDSSRTLSQVRENVVLPAQPVQAPDTTTTSDLKTISSARSVIRPDSVLGNYTIQPAPAVPERRDKVETTEVQAVQNQPAPAVAPQQRVQIQDSTVATTTTTTTPPAPATTREAAPARAEQRAPVKTQEATQVRTDQRAPVRVQETTPVRTSETVRVVERPVYVPSQVSSAPARSTVADTEQLRQERIRLNAVNAENRRLQDRIDAIQAAPQTSDTLATGAAVAADTSLVQYLQQQAALNDSMLQRLNQYEQELALLKNTSAAPVEAAPAAAPASNSTTVFYPINAHRIPPESLRELNQVLKALQENPATAVKLTGYTSQSGNAAYNLALSRKRVEALETFLLDQGIAKERITTQYMGDEKSSQKENPLDRKVEVEIIE